MDSTEPPSLLPDLHEDFPPHTYEQWREAAELLLKGAPFDKRLVTPLPEGFSLQPLYRREDAEQLPHLGSLPGFPNHARGGRASGNLARIWAISQELDCATPDEFDRVARAEVARGQDELNIPLDAAVRSGRDPDHSRVGEVGRGGLSLATAGDLERALHGIPLDKVSLYFRTGAAALPVATLLFAMARNGRTSPATLRGCLEADPLGNLAAGGSLPISLATAWRNIAILTRFASRHAPGLQTLAVQGAPYHDAGATAVQELACALATAVEYVRNLAAEGIAPDTVARHLRFSLAVGPNFFLEIAKLRAARLLWHRALSAGGVEDPPPAFLHARTGRRNKTVYDPHVNLLRAASEALSAVLGGCDALHIDPFDAVLRQPDEFSRRIARNAHFILAEECELRRVIDPAGGSWYIEWLTDRLAREAWTLFQSIEAQGGMAAALAAGMPQEQIARAGARRLEALRLRRETLVGTNLYPNPQERPLENRAPDYAAIFRARSIEIDEYRRGFDADARRRALDGFARAIVHEPDRAIDAGIEAFSRGATLGEVTRTLWTGEGQPARARPLEIRRAAEDFETLRRSSDTHLEQTGHRPRVLQLNIGPSRLYRLRADWTSAFFHVGGFEVLADRDFDTPAAAVDALRDTDARVAIIASTDERYAECAADLARAARAARPDIRLLLAGAPGDSEAAWRDAGIDGFVHARSNCHDTLRDLLQHLGILTTPAQ